LPTRADKGVEAYYQTARKDDPKLLFFAVFASQDAYDSHIQQEHAKRTFAAFQGKLAEEPVRTELVELE
jgi:quinol monooxygenase YgiN